MSGLARRITLAEWEEQYCRLRAAGVQEPQYGGPLGRHVARGDTRLTKLKLDDSAAALRLWNFLLTEEDRLHQARAAGKRLVAAMKDLGTVPVMAYALDNMVAFYADGAWWIPCVMEGASSVLAQADALGIDDTFCPVRAMLGAFVNQEHFPIADLLTCSVGATCDDVTAIAGRIEGLGLPILWWEVPHRRAPEPGEPAIALPGGFVAPESQLAIVRSELGRIRRALEELAGQPLTDGRLVAGIARANELRRRLAELRRLVFTAPVAPLPALESLIAEMLAIHYCSDQAEAIRVVDDLLDEVRRRIALGVGVLPAEAVRVFWVNPVADLRIMNLLEDVGGRVCGSEYLFCHALDPIPEDIPPLDALSRMVLADPMVGSPADRAGRICADARRFGAEAVVLSRIPGASHCGLEGAVIGPIVRSQLTLPVLEIEVMPLNDSIEPTLRTRLEALIETALSRRPR